MAALVALSCFGESGKPGVVAAAVDRFMVARGAVGVGSVAGRSVANIHIFQMGAGQRMQIL